MMKDSNKEERIKKLMRKIAAAKRKLKDLYNELSIEQNQTNDVIVNVAPGSFYVNSIGQEFALIPAGKFIMGGGIYSISKPKHKVVITKPFYLGTSPLPRPSGRV